MAVGNKPRKRDRKQISRYHSTTYLRELLSQLKWASVPPEGQLRWATVAKNVTVELIQNTYVPLKLKNLKSFRPSNKSLLKLFCMLLGDAQECLLCWDTLKADLLRRSFCPTKRSKEWGLRDAHFATPWHWWRTVVARFNLASIVVPWLVWSTSMIGTSPTNTRTG